MENFVKGFSECYPFVPVNLYGKFSSMFPSGNQSTTSGHNLDKDKPRPTASNEASTVLSQTAKRAGSITKDSTKPKILISLKRTNGLDWTQANSVTQASNAPNAPNAATPSTVTPAPDVVNRAPSTGNAVAATVAENVSSFLSGIRASFRQDNVNVDTGIRPRVVYDKVSNSQSQYKNSEPTRPNKN